MFPQCAGACEGAAGKGACPAAARAPAPTGAVVLTEVVADRREAARCTAATVAARGGAGRGAAAVARPSAVVASRATATAPVAVTESTGVASRATVVAGTAATPRQQLSHTVACA